jgi:hypothetical protein
MLLTGLHLIHIAAAAVFQRATAMSTEQTLHWQFAHNCLFHSAPLHVITKKHRTLSADSCTVHGQQTRQQQTSSLNSVWFVKVRSRLLPAPLHASSSVQPIIVITTLNIKCAGGVSCLHTPLRVTLCSFPFQLNKYIHKREHFFIPEGKLHSIITNINTIRWSSTLLGWILFMLNSSGI